MLNFGILSCDQAWLVQHILFTAQNYDISILVTTISQLFNYIYIAYWLPDGLRVYIIIKCIKIYHVVVLFNDIDFPSVYF